MIRNIVFDLGGVALHYRPDQYLEELGFSEPVRTEIGDAVFRSSLWQDLDRGTLNFEEAIEIVKRRHPRLSQEIDRVFAPGWMDSIIPFQETIGLIKGLRGYKLFVLSNFPGEWYDYVEQKYDFFQCFDGKVISSREGYNKPEKEIYDILLSRYGLIAEETVFIDDMAANIEGAGKLGIHGVVYTGLKDLVSQLKLLGVKL